MTGWLKASQQRQDLVTAYLCLAPWLIGFAAFVIGPMLFSLGLSFYDTDLLTYTRFIGLANYSALWTDELFWQSLKVTLIYAGTVAPLGSLVALSIALLLNQKLIGVGFWRTIYYLPTVISSLAIALVWLQMFNPRAGLISHLLRLIGLRSPSWLYDSTWALPALILMSLWGVGANLLLYLAGLQAIPTQLYEAATIDGANGWQRLRVITLPLLSPTIFFNLLINLIWALQLFTEPYIMTDGGPNNATLSMVLFLYRKAFAQVRFGYAAVAWVLFAVILSCTLLFQALAKRWVYYAGEPVR